MKENIIICLILFIVLNLFLYVWNRWKLISILTKKKSKRKKSEFVEVKYLNIAYGIKKEKLLNMKMIIIFNLINTMIISLTFYIILLIPLAIIWQLLIGFIILLGLIYSVYGIFGKILIKKGFDR